MNTSDRAKRSALRIVLLTCVGLIALTALAIWRIRVQADRRWDAFSRELTALRAGIAAKDATALRIVTPEHQDNAWPHYERAMAELANRVPDLDPVREFVHGSEIDAAAVERLLAAAAPAFEHLARGTRSAQGKYAYDWTQANSATTPDVGAVLELVDAVRAQAQRAHTAGDPARALTALLDACQLCLDMGQGAPLICELVCYSGIAGCIADFAALARDANLPTALQAELGASLAKLERALPDPVAAREKEIVWMGTALHEADGGTAALGGDLNFHSWRHFFSPRLMMVEGWEHLRDGQRELATWPATPWRQARAAAQARINADRRSDNVIVKLCSTAKTYDYTEERRIVASLRLVRAALAWRRDGTRPALEDPFGAQLLWDTASPRPRIWSVGADGIDDGGHGGLYPRDAATPDIVIELSK